MKISKELLKGNTATMILTILAEGDSYGYGIASEIARRTKDAVQLQTGTLYPILHTMVKEGLISEYERESDSRRVRKYYHITAAGLLRLATLKEEWRLLSESMQGVLEGK